MLQSRGHFRSYGEPPTSRTTATMTTYQKYVPRKSRLVYRLNRHGSATLELALILPLLTVIVFGIISFGALMFTQTNMETAARETVRRVSVQDITLGEAEAAAQSYLATLAGAMTFTVTATQPTATDVSVVITVPMSQAAMVDILGIFSTGLLRSAVTMRMQGT